MFAEVAMLSTSSARYGSAPTASRQVLFPQFVGKGDDVEGNAFFEHFAQAHENLFVGGGVKAVLRELFHGIDRGVGVDEH